jgi:hypothetical protein
MKSINKGKLCLFVVFAISLLWIGLSSAQAASVYVLRSGNVDSDAAVQAALTDGGHDVTLGVPTPTFRGTEVNLDDYDAVVILNSFNYSAGSMPSAGMFALVKYLCNGGGIVTGEWFIYNTTRGTHGFLDNVVPVSTPSFNTATSTTYTQDTADPVLNDGLPPFFTFNLASISGSESSFDAKAGATVFYRSSNGGGRPTAPAVVGWTSMNGKVLSLSTLISQTELQTDPYKILLVNAVQWVARSAK